MSYDACKMRSETVHSLHARVSLSYLGMCVVLNEPLTKSIASCVICCVHSWHGQ